MAQCIAETREQMLLRHEKEREQLKQKIEAMKSSVSKNDKAAMKNVNRKIKEMEEALRDRQAMELSDLETGGDDGYLDLITQRLADTSVSDNSPQSSKPAKDEAPKKEEGGAKKPSRAQKRRAAQAQKAKAKEERMKEVEGMRDSARQKEIDAINTMLRRMNKQLYEVAPDGNCLYASIADQLRRQGEIYDVATLRAIASNYMLDNRDDFVPFLDIPPEEFENYCAKVRSDPQTWGSQIEITALVHALKVPIEIYSADAPVVRMGDEYTSTRSPLLLSCVPISGTVGNSLMIAYCRYHKHMYTLGEHYNSIVSIDA